MILTLPNKIYISSANVDMRKSIDGLVSIVEDSFNCSSTDDAQQRKSFLWLLHGLKLKIYVITKVVSNNKFNVKKVLTIGFLSCFCGKNMI